MGSFFLSSDPRQLTPHTYSTNMGDMANAACMADGFEKIQKLPDPVPGCPNFRRVPGFKVYCCGQPTIAGFENALNKVCGDKYPKDGPIIWFNLRQEPDVYVNGEPICARPPNKIGEYAELGDITRDIAKANEVEFLRQVEMRKNDNGGKLTLTSTPQLSSMTKLVYPELPLDVLSLVSLKSSKSLHPSKVLLKLFLVLMLLS